MRVFGLTGKTGAGKSTVASLLKEKGVFIIDGDLVARQIVSVGSPALKKLCEAFSEDILLSDGSLDRKVLAQKAFSSKENTALLNSITHPFIKSEFEKLITEAKNKSYPLAVIDAAALLESDCRKLCEKIIVVHAPSSLRLERILLRDGITESQALVRMNGQKNDDYYLSQADYIIENSGNTEKIISSLKELFYEEKLQW